LRVQLAIFLLLFSLAAVDSLYLDLHVAVMFPLVKRARKKRDFKADKLCSKMEARLEKAYGVRGWCEITLRANGRRERRVCWVLSPDTHLFA
jgi:hypothetical protein